MIPQINTKLTNWTDGMKISKEHFVNSENALLDLIRDTTATTLTNYNYGLLAPLPGERKSLDCMVLSSQGGNFKVSVSLCRAVTAGGQRIEIVPGVTPELISDSLFFSNTNMFENSRRNNSNAGSGNFLLVITADPFNREASGAPDPEEFPARHPSCSTRYTLNLLPEESMNAADFGLNHAAIARFRFKNEELIQDNTYVPPCTMVVAHQGLIQMYNLVNERINKIQEFSNNIVQRVITKAQNTPLALNIKKICENLVWHISAQFFMFRTTIFQLPPLHMANSIVQIANNLKVTLDFIPEKEKEEVLQYFRDWNDISPGRFDEILASVINVDYDHEAIYDSFRPLLEFLNIWTDILEKLNELELIGRKKESDMFVREIDMTSNKPNKPGKRGFSILD